MTGVIVVWLILSIFVAVLAGRRGRNGFGWFLLSIVLTPLVSLICVIAVGDTDEKYKEKMIRDAKYKESIKKDHTKADAQASAIAELKKLKDLFELDVITKEEYEAKRSELIPIIKEGSSVVNDNSIIVKDNITPIKKDSSNIQVPKKPNSNVVSKNSNIYVFLIIIISILGLISLAAVCINASLKEKNKTASYVVPKEDLLDNSFKHQQMAKEKFLEKLYKNDDYLKNHGKITSCFVDCNSFLNKYEISIEFEIERMKKVRTEVYKGYVKVFNGNFEDVLTYRATKLDENTDEIIGRWIITNKYSEYISYDLTITREGSKYYAYEHGEKERLTKKDNKYYEVGNKAGQYFMINGTYLRLCDKEGEYTHESGYIITYSPLK